MRGKKEDREKDGKEGNFSLGEEGNNYMWKTLWMRDIYSLHSLTQSLTHLLIPSLTHSLNHTLIDSLTHTLTQSLTY